MDRTKACEALMKYGWGPVRGKKKHENISWDESLGLTESLFLHYTETDC